MQSLAAISALDRTAFVATLGHIYETSPWVADAAYAKAPFASVTLLAAAMKAAVDTADDAKQLALLRAHPDLAGKAALAGEVTADSSIEQKSAGLGALSKEELNTFNEANAAYTSKYGFPFILAVRHASKATILGALTGPRLTAHTKTVEMAQALAQVHKIAWMRLLSLVSPAPTGFLTCHVLDTGRGCPAAGMRITLARREAGSGGTSALGEWVTNSDGRFDGGPAIKHGSLSPGAYEWKFYAGDYFTAAGVPTSGQPFLDVITLAFGIDNPEDHYHVPLLVSPWSYSTYRGS